METANAVIPVNPVKPVTTANANTVRSFEMFEARFTIATKLGWSLVQAYPLTAADVYSDDSETRALTAKHASYYDVRPPQWSQASNFCSIEDTIFTWAGLDIAVPSYFWDDHSFHPRP